MALLYSYQNQSPVPLPERFRLADGTTLRPPLSAGQLGELGWKGPIEIPDFDSATQVLLWDTNDMEYVVVELPESEIAARKLEEQKAAANYRQFYNALIIGAAYQEIRGQAQQSLALTVACTEFVAAMADAKAGEANIQAMQACIDGILAAATLTDEHLQELYLHMSAAGLWGLLNLGTFEPVIPEPTPLPEEPVAEEPVIPVIGSEGEDSLGL